MLNATSVDDFLSHVDENSYGNGTTDASRPLIMTNRAVANLNVVEMCIRDSDNTIAIPA